VVLVGDGTFDYKNNRGYGDNLLPTMMVSTPYGLFGSDNWFVDVEGDDGVPEMAIGRVPVLTDEELERYIAKIEAYENAYGDWTKRVLMLADNPDGNGNFPSDSDEVAHLLPKECVMEKIYLSNLPLSQARQRVLDGIDAGAAIVNYIGHSGLDRLADEGLLVTSDVDGMANGDEMPIVTAMTCVVGRFSMPGYDALSEALVVKDNGGAIAVWAPTGMSVNAQAKILDKEFFRAAFKDEDTTLGQAILASLEASSNLGTDKFMLQIYTLLGDPALKMK
jgi:hypothetical protein